MNYSHLKRMRRKLKDYASQPFSLAHNLQAEQALIASVLVDAHRDYAAFHEATISGVTEESFNNIKSPLNGQIWQCIAELIEDNQPVNVDVLVAKMQLTEAWDNDVPQYIESLFYADINPAHVSASARVVVQDATRREAQIEGLMMTHELPKQDVKYLQNTLDRMTENAQKRYISERGVKAQDMSREFGRLFLSRVEENANKENRVLFDTSVEDVNALFGGSLRHGRLYFIGGPPKAGKTKFVTWLCHELMVRRDAIVNWCSVEMTSDETMSQFLACKTNRYVDEINGGLPDAALYSDEDSFDRAINAFLKQLIKGIADFGEHNFQYNYVDSEYSIKDIGYWAKMRVQQEGHEPNSKRPFVLVVDYVQGISPGGYVESERVAINKVSQHLRDLAKRLGIIVIGLYHSSRDNLDKVYGSAQLRKDANWIGVISRPGADEFRFKTYMQINTLESREKSAPRAQLRALLGKNQFCDWDGDDWDVFAEERKRKEANVKGGKR